jgi:hypothetical protein
MRARLFLPLVVSLVASALRGSVTVELAPHGTIAAGTNVDLTFRRVDAPAGAEEGPKKLQLTIGGTAGELPVERGTWSVDASADGIWHPTQYFVAQATGAHVLVPLWPSGWIVARLAMTKGSAAPDAVTIRFESPADSPDAAPATEVTCPVSESRIRCELPAGIYDMRMRATSHVPRYFAAVAVIAQKETDLGAVALQRGTALTGRVSLGRGVDVPLARAVVSVTPMNIESGDARSRGGTGAATIRTHPSAKGFFEIGGLAPGSYQVVARVAARYSSAAVAIAIVKDRSAELRDPLRLDEPQRIELRASPFTDPNGSRWRVTLERELSAGRNERLDDTQVREDGVWQSAPLHQGTYTLAIGPANGGVWMERDVEVGDAAVVVDADMHSSSSKGIVTLGDRALAAKLTFRSATVSAETEAKEDGTFSVLLPRDATEWDVDVHNERPPVRRTLRHVVVNDGKIELHLPSTVVVGDVALRDGTTPQSAGINIRGATDEPLVQVSMQRDGGFAVHGLEPGSYNAQAISFLRQSEPVTFTVDADGTFEPMHLVLLDEQKIRGRVVSDVAPIAGAAVTIIPVDVPGGSSNSDTTNLQGEFSATAPPASRELDVIVAAPGFALKMLHTAIQSSGFVTLKVHQNGGALEVPLGSGDLHPYIERFGAVVAVESLAFNWPQSRRAGRNTLVIDNVEPGPYTVCMLRRSEFFDFRAGRIDRGTRCAIGVLAPFSTLSLSVDATHR